MNVLITGGTGFIGSLLSEKLTTSGFTVYCLTRGTEGERRLRWNPESGLFPAKALDGTEVVIHLAGENIASQRWTPQIKTQILQSRLQSTALIARAIKNLSHPPRIFLAASAIGYYGNRGPELLDEDSPAGVGFLAEVCKAWEKAALEAESLRTRVIRMRFGVVLDPSGGALKKMLPPFRFGVGGRLGSGAQYMSWISRNDVIRAITHCINSDSVSGAVNLTSPEAVTNLEFTRHLGWALRRPTFCAVPAFVARLALGEMAEEMLLSSTRVAPTKLLESGFTFQDRELATLFDSFFRGNQLNHIPGRI